MPPKTRPKAKQSTAGTDSGSRGKGKDNNASAIASRVFGESRCIREMGLKEAMKASGAVQMARVVEKGSVPSGLLADVNKYRVTFDRSGRVKRIDYLKHEDAFRLGSGSWEQVYEPCPRVVDPQLVQLCCRIQLFRQVLHELPAYVKTNIVANGPFEDIFSA